MTSSFCVLMKCYDITDFFAHWILSSLFVKIIWPKDLENTLNIMGTEAEIQIAEAVSRLQHLFLNPSWLVWGKASRHQKLAPTFSWIDKCLIVVVVVVVVVENIYKAPLVKKTSEVLWLLLH